MPIFTGDGRSKRHINDDLQLAQDEEHWKCKRCEGWFPKEEFFGVRPSNPDRIVEYQLCGSCRKPMRGRPGRTKEEHERIKQERFERNQ